MSRKIKEDGTECSFSSKCPKCGGRLGSSGTRLSKRFGVVTRTRKCIKCGHKVYTAEVDFDDFQRQEVLIRSLEKSITEYLNKTNEVKK
ncbi:MAG: hypothetical protein IMZ52_01095 [Actinobacteria bacterium]|nr:hypothetical protein [Actinomycetota bacterium]MBE3114734.1 hypothetical protein [Actinomycetota bacterium]